MSKTLKLKNLKDLPDNFESKQAIRTEVLALDAKEDKLEAKKQVIAYTRDELLAMLRAMSPDPSTDPTLDLPTGEIPAHLIADKSKLPPPEERASTLVQAPPNVHGSFTLNGIPVMASPIKADIDPRTGAPYIQPGPRPSTMISPPPSRRFDGR